MRSKKIICAILAATMTTTIAFASCGDSSSKADATSKPESSAVEDDSSSQAQQSSAKDLNDIANKLKDSLDDAVKATMTEFTPDRIDKIIGVKADLYNKAVCIVDASGASAHEIDCFEAKDENAAKEIETALKTRIENQKTAFKDYVPAEMDKLNSPVLVVDGNYVIMCLSNNNDKAKEIIG